MREIYLLGSETPLRRKRRPLETTDALRPWIPRILVHMEETTSSIYKDSLGRSIGHERIQRIFKTS